MFCIHADDDSSGSKSRDIDFMLESCVFYSFILYLFMRTIVRDLL